MRRLNFVLVCLCVMAFAQTAQAQMFYSEPVLCWPPKLPTFFAPPIVRCPPPPVIYHCPPVVRCPPIVHHCPPVYIAPAVRHIEPWMPEKVKITNTSVDGVGTITTRKDHVRRIAGHKVTDHRQDRNGVMRTTYRWEDTIDIFTFEQSVDIPQMGDKKVLNWYEETLTYVNGVSRRCYRKGWSMTDSGRQDWEREFVRSSAHDKWKKIVDNSLPTIHIEINPPKDYDSSPWLRPQTFNTPEVESLPRIPVQPYQQQPRPTPTPKVMKAPMSRPMVPLLTPTLNCQLVSDGGWRGSER